MFLIRYKRGLRSLSDNLKVGASGDCHGFQGDADVNEDESNVQVSEVIEKVVGEMLSLSNAWTFAPRAHW